MQRTNNILAGLADGEIRQRVGIGSCQPRFYKPAAWKKAKELMEFLCSLGLAEPFDFGRGKGKYLTDLDPEIITQTLITIRDA